MGRLEEGSTGCLAVREVARGLWPARLGSLKGRAGVARGSVERVRASRRLAFSGSGGGSGRAWKSVMRGVGGRSVR